MINPLVYACSRILYSSKRGNATISNERMGLTNKGSHTQKQTYCVVPFIHSSEKAKLTWHIQCCMGFIFGDERTSDQDGA